MFFLSKIIKRTVLKSLETWKQSVSARNNYNRSRTNYEISVKKRQRMMARDRVSDSYTPIYSAPFGTYVRVGYPIVVVTALSGPVYYLIKFGMNPDDGSFEINKKAFKDKINTQTVDFYVLMATSIIFAGVFLGVLYKFPYRIYVHKDKAEYIAIFQSLIPFRSYHLYFKRAQETKFRNPLYFFIEDGQYLLGKKKAVVMPFNFRTSYDLCQMLGVK